MGLSADLAEIYRRICSRGRRDSIFAEDARKWLETDSEFGPLLNAVGRAKFDSSSQLLLVLRALAQNDAVAENTRAEISLVVTDPSMTGAGLRFTGAVVREMCEAAEREIFLAGFAIAAGSGLELLLPAAAARGCRITVVSGAWARKGHATGAKAILEDWPASTPPPVCYVHDAAGAGQMHIKALIIDGADMLVGSANFTFAAVKNNFELGLRVRGKIAADARKFLEAMAKSPRFKQLG